MSMCNEIGGDASRRKITEISTASVFVFDVVTNNGEIVSKSASIV